MRLTDDAREAMREALILRIGDREADESREERDARTDLLQEALTWLDSLDATLLEAFRAGIKQEQEQHDFDYHGGKIDPSAQEVQA